MGLFLNNKYDNIYNMYSIKKYVDKKLIAFIVAMIIFVILILIASVYYIVDTKIRVKRAEEFAEQLIEYNQEQQEIKQKEEEEKQDKIPILTDEGKQNIQNIYESETKRAFLTFDDGPSNNTRDILNILDENEIKATFFVLGSQVQAFPETTKEIYEKGHYIANHGYSHIYSEIYQSPETVLNEFNQCNQIVADTIGVPEYNSHLFRFPGGLVGGKYAQIKVEAKSLLEQNDIVSIDWNSLTGDSEKVNPTEEYLMNNLQRTTDGKNSIVLLMHDSQAKRVTVDFLQKAIDYLKEQGYEFENFYSIIK